MKKREIIINGNISDKGTLSMYMHELNAFMSEWKGHRVIATFKVLDIKASKALKGYYFYGVVPIFMRAFADFGEMLTNEQTEEKLREIAPMMREEEYNENTEKYDYNLKSIHSLSNSDMLDYIEFLKQYGAENYHIYIEDPKTF